MTKKTVIIATAVLALAGVIAVSQIQKKTSEPDSSQAREETPPGKPLESNASDMDQ